MKKEVATFASGCFWCTEAIFKRLKGVEKVESGYTGGTMSNPSYDDVVTGTTGHAEGIQVVFDPSIISYELLLEVFFTMHNPTTLNRQDYDVGTQYRSSIFYHSEDQRKLAEQVKAKFQKNYKDPIVTKIVPYEAFYKAEAYHADYYDKNPNAGYCRVIIDPKIQKLLKNYKDQVKEEFK